MCQNEAITYPSTPPSSQNSQKISTPDKDFSKSFIGKSGRFYIQNALNQERFAVYDNPVAYSERLQVPQYINKEFAVKDFLKYLEIPLKKIDLMSVR